jgi:AcrR family transcriptional regulator
VRLLNAGLALLEAGGPEAVTVTGVTHRARTSVGSFYARFQGKEDFLRYMGEGALEKSASVWREGRASIRAGGPPRVRVEVIVQSLAGIYLEGPAGGLARLDGVDDPAPTRRQRLEAFLAAELGEVLEVGPAKAALAARVATGILRDAAVTGFAPVGTQSEPVVLDRETLLSELTELLVGYVDPRGSTGAPDVRVPDPFEVWG